jgi:hypothetical protein
VVRHREVGVDPPRLTASQAQPFEGLRAGDLVYEVAIDIYQAGAVLFLADNMGVPELVVKGFSGHFLDLL